MSPSSSSSPGIVKSGYFPDVLFVLYVVSFSDSKSTGNLRLPAVDLLRHRPHLLVIGILGIPILPPALFVSSIGLRRSGQDLAVVVFPARRGEF